MKRIICAAMLSIVLAVAFTPPSASADSRAHRSAIKVCKQRYKSAIRGAKYLKQRQRNERIEQARRERAECERLAPR